MPSWNLAYIQSTLSTLNQTLLSLQESSKSFLPIQFLNFLHHAQQLIKDMDNYIRTQLATLSKMPSVLLLSIFQFLYATEYKRTQLVCKLWYHVWQLPIASQLRKIKCSARFLRSWDGPNSTSGVAHNNNSIFVRGTNGIYNFDLSGNFLNKFEITEDAYTQSLAIDKTGLLYIGLYHSGFIEVYTQDGKIERKWECRKPFALTISDDQIYVSSGSRNCKICQFTLEGKLIVEWGNIDDPHEIIIDKNEIFITDFYRHQILVFSKEKKKKPLRQWGTEGFNIGQFRNPYGMAINEDLVYVVDNSNRRIQVFTRNGTDLFQFSVPDSNTAPCRMIILNDMAYVTDIGTEKIHVFALE